VIVRRDGQSRILAAAAAFTGMLLACRGAFALDVSQYAHTPWKVRDGFVKGVISCIAQTPDGYLWLGTEFGLLRFDGVRTVAWQTPAGQSLPSNRIFSLLAARDGTLWIGTSKGLASWRGGKLTQFPALAGQAIRAAIVEDHQGTIWAGGLASSPPGKLCAIRNGGVQCSGDDGGLGNGVSGLYEDGKHNLWVGVRDGLWRWKPGAPEFYSATAPAANGGGIQGIAEDRDDALLFGAHNGIGRFAGGKTETFPLPPSAQQFIAVRMLRERDGDLWIGTVDRGLVHVQPGRTDVYSQADGLSGDFITALFTDREGTMWVATDGGLDRFRKLAVPTISLSQGLSNASVLSVLADGDGSVWLSTRRGLNHWTNGRITTFGQNGLLNGDYAGSMFQDSRGRIWASTLHEFGYLDSGRFVALKNVPGGAVYSIREDHAGNLWIANRERGLIQLTREGRVEETLWAVLGHKDPALALAVDPVRHGLWIGFQQGGIAYIADGRLSESYSSVQGLGDGRVNGLRFDADGTLWAATDGGLSRLKSGRIATLGTKSGLPCDGVHWDIEDNNRSMWLYTTCGLVRIDRAELDAWSSDSRRTIHPTLFDSSDGVRSLDDNGGYTPHAAKSSDGRIWFLPSDGASIVDPNHLPVNKLLPSVHVELITADQKEYRVPLDGRAVIPLPERVRDLEIEYTALSMVASEKVLFRYMLEGWDKDWLDVGTRRQAWYSNLPPREYRFRVIACNDSGVWNQAGASLTFSIAPAYYQTTWFLISCVAALLGILWAGYGLRLRQVERQFNMHLEGRLAERTRIARDLHDTMLQSFQAVLMKFQAVSHQLQDHPEARGALDSVVAQARQAIIEGRNAVQDLRSSTQVTNDLALAISTLGNELAAECTSGAAPEFHVGVAGTSIDLAPLVRDDVHRIACEAVRNAFRHAQASRIEVEIHYERRQLRVRILDNGKGIDPTVLSEGGRAGHFGLPGMQERAKFVGGKLTVRRGVETGTELELTIPASVAYRKSAALRHSV
jgi:signal transduction histidine kinase/ligand-binding sensor domain-containing protein